ncbi:hypothetical protein AMATHDRAFT_3617 [Amanita thiersii Skay4041]|uniref:C2 domain-containing protein n=1 Tax=Amanita thiersii Skay4041 TaxID=703135 RepID=A0A2A9NSV6_9AGAR|nr:hypothetical protein AMATHDRAFT_3617 [Amanita thiersii Skay4041]
MQVQAEPAGVIRVGVQSARIRPWCRLLGSPPDPFVVVQTNHGQNMVQTAHKSHSFEPTWMETLYVVVYPQDSLLEVHLYSAHEHRDDTILGMTHFPLFKLMQSKELTGLVVDITKSGKHKADLLLDLTFYPANTEVSPVQPKPLPFRDLEPGVVTMTIHEAADLDVTHHGTPSVQIGLGLEGPPIHITAPGEDSVNPVWDSIFDFFCLDKGSASVMVKVVIPHWSAEETVGHMLLPLEDLLESYRTGVDWWPLGGCNSGKVRISVRWTSVDMHASL